MRFFADGPDIPDNLLVARDAGQVIFFCGAGVSMARAGLPDFSTLASKVIDGLGSTSRSPARTLFQASKAQAQMEGVGALIPADRIFSMLEREFEVADVHAEVARALMPMAEIDLSAHRTLLDLSRGPDGHSRIVTTNFDTLFQAADARLQVHTAPDLPDPRRPQDLRGLIHLHGRVGQDYAGAHDDAFVLSSADFGRAYLADGWATRFIQGLMEGYQLVFLGYSADDPPVQYLLEALSGRSLAGGGLYAFQEGSPDEAHARWRSKGVRAIAYDPADRHSALWRTLEAWAERARDPNAWQDRVLRRAKRGPEALAPHERGWVQHLAKFPESARKFAEAKLPGDWLCVFDPAVRYGSAERSYGDEPGFDPFEAYGLDDDPVPARNTDEIWSRRGVPAGVWDAFAPSDWDGEVSRQGASRFRGQWAAEAAELSPRHQQLSRWIAAIADHPAAAWWASGQQGLHPNIIQSVLDRFEHPYDEGAAAAAWRRLARSWRSTLRSPSEESRDFRVGLRRRGWSLATLRELEVLLRPRVKVGRPYSAALRPPRVRKPRRSLLVQVEVEHPKLPEFPEPPPELMPQFVDVLRRALERGLDVVMEEVGFDFLALPPINRDPDLVGGGRDQQRGRSPLFFAYLAAFQRLLALDATAALAERLRWRTTDPAFDRLRIWAAGEPQATDGANSAALLMGLDQDAFWEMRHQRDLLLALHNRWADFPAEGRRRLERRLLRGRSRWSRETPEQFAHGQAFSAMERIAWLEHQGCALHSSLAPARDALRAKLTNFNLQDGPGPAASLESRGGVVRTLTDGTILFATPLKHLLAEAAALASQREWGGLTERRPLIGFAARRPSRLFAALRLRDAAEDFPAWAWRVLIESDAPSLRSARARMLLAERLADLAPEDLSSIIHSVSRWLSETSQLLATESPSSFDRLWTRLLTTLRELPESGATAIRSSRPDWVMFAINSPPGHMAEAMMRHPVHQPADGGTFDPAWLAKVTELIALPEESGRLAAVTLLRNLHWFFHHDEQWAKANLLALRERGPVDRAAFWSGYLHNGKVPPLELYNLLKVDMLHLVSEDASDTERTDQLAGFLLAGWMTSEDNLQGGCVTDTELRDALVAGSDSFRAHALWQLERWLAEGDGAEVERRLLHLFREVWPRQRVTRSAKTSERLAELALGAEAAFPAFVDAIAPHLRPLENHFSTALAFDAVKPNLIEQHPHAVLKLVYALLSERVADWPYEAGALVARIAARPELRRDPRLAELRRRMAAR